MAEPKGRPTRARDKLRNNFLHALAEDFTAHGVEALEAMRTTDPSGYIRAIASLMPKELDVKKVNPLDHLSDEQLQQVIDTAEHLIRGEAGNSVEGGEKSLENISPLH